MTEQDRAAFRLHEERMSEEFYKHDTLKREKPAPPREAAERA